MKIIIIGAGASGIAAAINLKRKNPKDNILIIEHQDRPLKKILATGNGKCNIGNQLLKPVDFGDHEIINSVFSEYNFEEYQRYVESFSFKTRLNGNLLYPLSESAQTVRNQMLFICQKLGIEIKCNEKLLSYSLQERIVAKTNLAEYDCDKLIIACGGKSSSILGSDGSIFPILEQHHYHINKLIPGLVPIKTLEKTKLIDGVRVKGRLNLIQNNEIIWSEAGEILFKDHGLSGIVTLNASNIIASLVKKDVKISIDLLPEISQEMLEKYQQITSKSTFLSEYLQPKMITYFRDNKYDENIAFYLKNLPFTFDDFYSFENSQITIGGISLDDVKLSLESKYEPGVYFVGEVLDVQGPCGGYNLTWALMSAKRI